MSDQLAFNFKYYFVLLILIYNNEPALLFAHWSLQELFAKYDWLSWRKISSSTLGGTLIAEPHARAFVGSHS